MHAPDCECEEEIAAELVHGDAGKEAKPMKVALCSEAVENETSRCEKHDRQQDAETHLGLANAVVPPRQICSKSIGGAGEWNGKQIADDGRDSYKAAVRR